MFTLAEASNSRKEGEEEVGSGGNMSLRIVPVLGFVPAGAGLGRLDVWTEKEGSFRVPKRFTDDSSLELELE